MIQWLKQQCCTIYRYLTKQVVDAGHQVTLFGIVMMINYPLFGVFWKFDGFQCSEEFFLRLVATTLCALLAFNKYWPAVLQKFLPAFWYLSLLFCLPYFFAYLTLLNHGATSWLMNCVSAIFFLLLVTSVLGALVLLSLGIGLAFLCYFQNPSNVFAYIPGTVSLFSLLITYTAAIIIGALFARDREATQQGRISGMRLLAGSIAHDLRTPLASIHLQAVLQEMILDKLNHSEIQQDLKASLNKITRGIEMGNQLITMQLNNIKQEKFDTSTFIINPVRSLLEKTLEDYPMNADQRALLHFVEEADDYQVWMGEVAFRNLIWNLLKNSFESITEAGKGYIGIWLEPGKDKDDFNYLHIKDTGKGIDTKKSERLFESYYSEHKQGTGLGLAYCKRLMETAGGDIYCKGRSKEYAHFIIKFPKVD